MNLIQKLNFNFLINVYDQRQTFMIPVGMIELINKHRMIIDFNFKFS